MKNVYVVVSVKTGNVYGIFTDIASAFGSIRLSYEKVLQGAKLICNPNLRYQTFEMPNGDKLAIELRPVYSCTTHL